MRNFVTIALVSVFLGGCASDPLKLREINQEPPLSRVGSGLVATPPMTSGYAQQRSQPLHQASLWSDRQSHLFTDARALSVGDVMTVQITINDKAKFSNESERSRSSDRNFGLGGKYGVNGAGGEGNLDFDVGAKSKSAGGGQTERSETLRLSVAAVVTEVLPNGNLIISGTQEVRVNAELRVLTISGIVRPQDIEASNTISYERIAEARISYGGRGRLSEVQQPTYGQQFLDKVLPF
jgi:flagellar L-ring protein precursor FlgH